jgi:hypothetical protein
MNGLVQFLLTLFIYALLLYVLYWVIRLAVRHAIADARHGSATLIDAAAHAEQGQAEQSQAEQSQAEQGQAEQGQADQKR